MSPSPTAQGVVDELHSLASEPELVKVRRRLPPDEPAIGVRMRSVFDVAKSGTAMSLGEWERLVAEPAYEARMVDRAAPRVVGAAVAGGPYDVLTELAGSADPLRRRSAITAPLWFTRHGDLADLAAGFDVAARLRSDADASAHKAVGIFLAHAGQRDPAALTAFLDRYAASMPATARRLATRKQAAG